MGQSGDYQRRGEVRWLVSGIRYQVSAISYQLSAIRCEYVWRNATGAALTLAVTPWTRRGAQGGKRGRSRAGRQGSCDGRSAERSKRVEAALGATKQGQPASRRGSFRADIRQITCLLPAGSTCGRARQADWIETTSGVDVRVNCSPSHPSHAVCLEPSEVAPLTNRFWPAPLPSCLHYLYIALFSQHSRACT